MGPRESISGSNTSCVSCGHYDEVVMGTVASQITGLTIVYSTVHSGADISVSGRMRQLRVFFNSVIRSAQDSDVSAITLRTLRWRHNGHDGALNHQPHDCLLNRLFRCKSKKTSKLRVTGLCAGNSPGTGKFPAQMASNAENISIWWRYHVIEKYWFLFTLTPLYSGQNS